MNNIDLKTILEKHKMWLNDENRWNECAPGIHHYITREEAVRH